MAVVRGARVIRSCEFGSFSYNFLAGFVAFVGLLSKLLAMIGHPTCTIPVLIIGDTADCVKPEAGLCERDTKTS